jgi:hypothetical protein
MQLAAASQKCGGEEDITPRRRRTRATRASAREMFKRVAARDKTSADIAGNIWPDSLHA